MSRDYHKKNIGDHELKPESLMMSYGYDPKLSEGSVKCPNFQTSTFVFNTAEDGKEFFNIVSGRKPLPEGEQAGLVYSRFNNPVLEIAENRIAIWDNADDCLVFSSGMAAISTTAMALLRPGDVIVYSEPIYGGTDTLFNGLLKQYGIHAVGFMSNDGIDGLQKAVTEAQKLGRIGMFMLETPDNPSNNLLDLAACSELAHSLGKDGVERPIVVADNTMLGPVLQQPLSHGADICLYSLTKYVGGHSDLIGGAISGERSLVDKVRKVRNAIGTMMDSHTAWLILRSLETLKLRMNAANEGAARVVEFLREHEKVTKIMYLGELQPGDPQYDVYKKQCKGAGSTFSFEVTGGEEAAFKVLNALKLIKLAVSLGGTESLAQHPAAMTHSGVPKERRDLIGITDGTIRVSIGVEDPEDIIADLRQALDA